MDYTEYKDTLNTFKDTFVNTDINEKALRIVSSERGIDIDILKDADVFFINEQTRTDEKAFSKIPQLFVFDNAINGRKYTLDGKVVFPIKDLYGDVISFTGWDKYSVRAKYFDLKTEHHVPKKSSFYGMDKMNEYTEEAKPIIFTEGIFNCLTLRQLGFNSCCILGSSPNTYIKTFINELMAQGHKIFFLADTDESGNKCIASNIRSNITSLQIKNNCNTNDINQMLTEGNYTAEVISKNLSLACMKMPNEIFEVYCK